MEKVLLYKIARDTAAAAAAAAVAADAVLFEPQTLTDPQKTQARSNIGAAPDTAVLYTSQSLTQAQSRQTLANLDGSGGIPLGVQFITTNGAVKTFWPAAGTAAARGAALTAALAAANAANTGGTIMVGAGDYEAPSGGFSLLVDNLSLIGSGWGTRIYPVSGGVGSFGVINFGVPAVSGVRGCRVANLQLDGNSEAGSGFGGIFLQTSRDNFIDNIWGHHHARSNGCIATNGNLNPKRPTVTITNCHFNNNTISNYLLGEFAVLANNSYEDDASSIVAEPGGNTQASNLLIKSATDFGIRIKDGSNDSHGSWENCRLVHCSGDSVCVEANADLGSFFSNPYIESDDNSHGFIRCNAGAQFDGGYLNAPFAADSVPTSAVMVNNCQRGSLSIFSGVSAAERLLFILNNTRGLDGVFKSDNDPQSLSYDATPVAAAGAGGGVAGAAALPDKEISYITSDGATKGVKFPTFPAGQRRYVINTSSTAANLFAASGGTINGGAADAGCAIPASKGVMAIASATNTLIVTDMPARAGAAA